MIHPTALATLRSFRQELYDDGLGHRQDSLFDLQDAVLTAPTATSLVRLSLCGAFRRRWPSTADALSDGSLDVPRVRRLVRRHLPPSSGEQRVVWVAKHRVFRRAAAATSPERTYGHVSTDGTPQDAIVAAWEYQWLVLVPEPAAGGSWALPLDVRRRHATAATPTQAILQQVRAVRRAQGPAAPRPVVALDSGYDPRQLATADVDADWVVRLAKHRVFRRAPGPYRGRGAPTKHGPAFKLKDPTTHGPADRAATAEHPR